MPEWFNSDFLLQCRCLLELAKDLARTDLHIAGKRRRCAHSRASLEIMKNLLMRWCTTLAQNHRPVHPINHLFFGRRE